MDEEEPNTIRYPEALPGTDIELSAQSEGVVKETIWLERPPSSSQEASWRFALELEGLEPELAEDGGIDLVNAATGAAEGHIPAGYMEDTNYDPHSGDGAWSEDVEFSLAEESGGWVLEVSADYDWLTDDERVYPVGVDPTAAWNYNASQDTFVQSRRRGQRTRLRRLRPDGQRLRRSRRRGPGLQL